MALATDRQHHIFNMPYQENQSILEEQRTISDKAASVGENQINQQRNVFDIIFDIAQRDITALNHPSRSRYAPLTAQDLLHNQAIIENERRVDQQLDQWREILNEGNVLGPDKALRLFGSKYSYTTPFIPSELMKLVSPQTSIDRKSLESANLVFMPKVSWKELEKAAKSLGIRIKFTYPNSYKNHTFLTEHNNRPVEPTWQLLGDNFRPYGSDSSIVQTTIPAEICKILLFYNQKGTFKGTPCYNSTGVFSAVTIYPTLPQHDERRFVIRLNEKEITISILEDEFEV